VLVCYDFHSGIFDELKDSMFVIKLKLFSIRTIVVPIPIRLEQPNNLIALACLNLFEHVYVPIELVSLLLVLFDTLVESIFVLLVQIVIPLDTFKHHLPKKKFQP
jgi:hypothetical protein